MHRSPFSSTSHSSRASESPERSTGYHSLGVRIPPAPPTPGSGPQSMQAPLDQDIKDILCGAVDWLDQPVHHAIVNVLKDISSSETKFIHSLWQSESEIPTWLRALWSDGKPVPFHFSRHYFDQIDPHFNHRKNIHNTMRIDQRNPPRWFYDILLRPKSLPAKLMIARTHRHGRLQS